MSPRGVAEWDERGEHDVAEIIQDLRPLSPDRREETLPGWAGVPRPPCPLGAGSYYWAGAAGTWFWIDPETDLTFVGMIQHFGSREVQQLSRNLVYQAVIAPSPKR